MSYRLVTLSSSLLPTLYSHLNGYSTGKYTGVPVLLKSLYYIYN